MQTGKYARIEFELRFLLGGLPGGASRAACTTIVDRYIRQTRFRLRRMVEPEGQTVTYKLTQKYAHLPGNFASVVITNTYLTVVEYQLFATLPADELSKERYRYRVDGKQYAVDRFQGPLAGLVLAEIEFASDQELSAFSPPAFALADVTNEEAFTGGVLCRSTAAEVQASIARTLGKALPQS